MIDWLVGWQVRQQALQMEQEHQHRNLIQAEAKALHQQIQQLKETEKRLSQVTEMLDWIGSNSLLGNGYAPLNTDWMTYPSKAKFD